MGADTLSQSIGAMSKDDQRMIESGMEYLQLETRSAITDTQNVLPTNCYEGRR